MTTFHIAQINVGRILGPIDSAVMAEGECPELR